MKKSKSIVHNSAYNSARWKLGEKRGCGSSCTGAVEYVKRKRKCEKEWKPGKKHDEHTATYLAFCV